MQMDVLWRQECSALADGHRFFRNLWLRMAHSIAQGRTPVVLCGSAVPAQFEVCPECRCFFTSHYLALVAMSDTIRGRLSRSIGAGRSSKDPRAQ